MATRDMFFIAIQYYSIDTIGTILGYSVKYSFVQFQKIIKTEYVKIKTL